MGIFQEHFYIDSNLLHTPCIYNSLYYLINNREQTNIGQTQTAIYIKSTNYFSFFGERHRNRLAHHFRTNIITSSSQFGVDFGHTSAAYDLPSIFNGLQAILGYRCVGNAACAFV